MIGITILIVYAVIIYKHSNQFKIHSAETVNVSSNYNHNENNIIIIY